MYVIDGIKRQLHQQVQTAFDQIARLNEAKQQLIRVNFLCLSIRLPFASRSHLGSSRQTYGFRYL